tara:strand:+ start:514 stop:2760 length:2247 start_codon:yes stop_codon:yes gene_type:complete
MQKKKFVYNGEGEMPKRQKKVFSYQRFSSGNQEGGSSLERQDKKFREFFEREYKPQGYVFGADFVDKGISSFRSSNVSSGSLGRIIEYAKQGRVIREGDLIAIEDLDRFSRDNPITSLRRLFEMVLDYGIKIQFLNRSWIPPLDKENFAKHVSEIYNDCVRANEYSKALSDRVERALDYKKEKARKGNFYVTTQCPKWMEPKYKKDNKGKLIHCGFKPIPERAKVIRKIYKWKLSGLGAGKIVNKLNEEKIPAFTDGVKRGGKWTKAYIEKILKTPSVIGVYQPQKVTYQNGKRVYVNDGKAIKDYYGVAVVSEEVFFKVQSAKRKLQEGARSIAHAKDSTDFLFAGLLRCGYTKGLMGCNSKRENLRYYYPNQIRKNAKRKNDITNGWEIKDFEKQFIFFVTKLDWAKVYAAAKENKEQFDFNRSNEIEASIERVEQKLDNLWDAVEQMGLSDRIKKKIKPLEEEKKKLEYELSIEHEKISEVSDSDDYEAMRKVKQNIKKKKFREALIINIRERIESIELYGNGWQWTEKTFREVIPFLEPEFLAKYKDCNNGAEPKWIPELFPNITERHGSGKRYSGRRAGHKYKFFRVNFRSGYSAVYLPSENNIILLLDSDLTESQRAGITNLSGSLPRHRNEYSPRGFREDFPYEEYQKFINNRKRKTPAQDELKKLIAKVERERKNALKEMLKDDVQRISYYVERDAMAKRFEEIPLSKRESADLNKLKKKYPKDYNRIVNRMEKSQRLTP